jgi:hypothetical protein
VVIEMKKLFFILALAFAAGADIHTAASVAKADVQTAINASADGDTVYIPAGSYDIGTTGEIDITDKAISLIGAGVGQTVYSSSGTYGAVSAKNPDGKPVRISGISFNFTSGFGVGIGGNCKQWRIDHCNFSSSVFLVGVYVITTAISTNLAYGVVDNCNFTNCRVLVSYGGGHQSWRDPLGLGDSSATYVEDCVFTFELFGNALDDSQGGRMVFRYNKVYNSSIDAHSLALGFTTFFYRANRKIEFYENDFYAVAHTPPVNNYSAMRPRGGTGVVFNNRVHNQTGEAYNMALLLDNVRDYETKAAPLLRCDGTNPLDGNSTPADSGWPCLDQIGRSTDYQIPNDTNRLPQASEPLWAWNNTIDGVRSVTVVADYSALHIKRDRDYVDTTIAKPGYTAYTYPHPLRNESAPPVIPNECTIHIRRP